MLMELLCSSADEVLLEPTRLRDARKHIQNDVAQSFSYTNGTRSGQAKRRHRLTCQSSVMFSSVTSAFRSPVDGQINF